MKKRALLWSLCAAVMLIPPPALAGFIIGPGDTLGQQHDGGPDEIVVDLAYPATFEPGDYVASQFNYRFSAGGDFLVTGSITPVLFTASTMLPDFVRRASISMVVRTSFSEECRGRTARTGAECP